MINTNECFNCGCDLTRPVEVQSEPPSIWCLDCVIENGVSFTTPEAFASIDEIEEAKSSWGCSYDAAYDHIENGDEIESDDDEV